MPEVQLTFEWDACEAPKPPSDARTDHATTAPRWNFKHTFPSPRPEALEAGLLGYDEVDSEAIQGIHDEQARHVLALLRDLDILAEANRTQTDPFTGKKPRTEKQRARLRETLVNAPLEVQREFDDAMDAYANVFGDEATEAYRATLVAWHNASGPSEIALQGAGARTASSVDAHLPNHYSPGHPWHYLAEGDGAQPVPVDQIPAAPFEPDKWNLKLPKDAAKRAAMLGKIFVEQTEQLAADITRYNDVLARGVEALSQYDREIAYDGNERMAVASTISFKFNHIAIAKGRLAWIERAWDCDDFSRAGALEF